MDPLVPGASFLLPLGVVYLMLLAGVRKGMLEWKGAPQWKRLWRPCRCCDQAGFRCRCRR
jgi:hypothetical protein